MSHLCNGLLSRLSYPPPKGSSVLPGDTTTGSSIFNPDFWCVPFLLCQISYLTLLSLFVLFLSQYLQPSSVLIRCGQGFLSVFDTTRCEPEPRRGRYFHCLSLRDGLRRLHRFPDQLAGLQAQVIPSHFPVLIFLSLILALPSSSCNLSVSLLTEFQVYFLNDHRK